MSGAMIWEGQFLFRNGKLAMDPACCCVISSCCPNMPDQLYVHFTNTCATSVISIVKVASIPGCSPRWQGNGWITCRLDAANPCLAQVIARFTLCGSTPCVISMECNFGDGFGDVLTRVISGPCDPLNLCNSIFAVPVNCGFCQINPGDPVSVCVKDVP